MESIEQLFVITEISVALAGFAGIIATFQSSETQRKRGHAIGLAMMVNVSLIDAGFCLFAIMLINIGLSDQMVWTIASGAMGVNYVLVMVYIIRFQMKGMNRRNRTVLGITLLLSVPNTVIGALCFANAFHIGFAGIYEIFYLSIIFPVYVVGFMFSRMLMRPVWRSIKKLEQDEAVA